MSINFERAYYAADQAEMPVTAGHILADFRGYRVFLLSGDLGSGKTTLVRAFAACLGVEEDVTSPTFSIVHTYEGDMQMFHFDLYRLNSINELHQIGFEEYLDYDALVFIEWPELAIPLIHEPCVSIEITAPLENGRHILCRTINNF